MSARERSQGCSCGHKLAFCHKVNAATWCGEPIPAEVYRDALVKCAELAGADLSGGIPTWPSLDVWAVDQVRELRKDYDDSLPSADGDPGSPPESPPLGAAGSDK